MPPESHQIRLADGVVVRSTGNWVEVRVGERIVSSRVRGRFRLSGQRATNPIAVGDCVSVRIGADDTGLITDIHERRSYLSRRAAGRRVGQEQVLAANIDALWIVQAARLPRPNSRLIDRVLVTAEAQEIHAGIVFNKMDLVAGDAAAHVMRLRDLYRTLGYEVHLTSAVTGTGVEAFRQALAGQASVITGPSGVGKSTLLNRAEPGLDLRAGAVSLKTRKGRHTTAHAALHALSDGGAVIDTPGIREFGVTAQEPWELSHYFPELRRYLPSCQYLRCTHDHEPGCSVKEAVQQQAITSDRYQSYLNILQSIRDGDADVGR